MSITVITPTVRPDGLKPVEMALKRQTDKDFEWIVIAPQHINISGYKRIDQLLSDPPKTEKLTWTLNRAYNKAVKKASGDLIISWQDYTFADPDAIEKWRYHFEMEPKTLVTGVGHKYQQVYPYPMLRSWVDPRISDEWGTYYGCGFMDVEWNFAGIPRDAIYAVGGFDEELDALGYGMDAYSVNERLNDLGGWDFKIDQTLKSYSLEHGRPEDWEQKNLVHGGYESRKQDLKFRSKWPVLEYLQ